MGGLLQWARSVARRAFISARAWLSRTDVRVGLGIVAVMLVVSLVARDSAIAATGDTSGPGVMGTIALWIGGIFMWMASGIGSVIATFIEVIVAVIQYNQFSTSPVVSAGWAIVRDAVNMFYVVVLIAIAFGTIIGMDRFQWKQQVPKLLRWAIIINFSKTLCGLAIDASQVVTLTFANALKDIAGGNFISFLGLTSIMSISSNADQIASLKNATAASGGALNPADFMISGVLALVLMLIVLAVLTALLAILAFRIVMLWILITVSPLAWFVGSIKGIVNSDAYSEWWNNFKCYLVIGPVLTFFLWLALAVAGAGNIAALEGFSVAETNNGGLINKIFDLPRITSFILGLSMIMAGFKVANQFCHGVQGESLISGALGKAKAFTKFGRDNAFLTAGVGAAKRVGGSRIPLVGEKGVGARAFQGKLAKAPLIGGALAGAMGGRAKAQEEYQKAQAAEKAAKVSDMGKSVGNEDAQFALLKEAQGKTLKGGEGMQATALVKKLVEDKEYRAKFEKAGGDVKSVMKNQGADVEKTFGKDDKFKKTLADFNASIGPPPDLMKNFNATTGEFNTDADHQAFAASTKANLAGAIKAAGGNIGLNGGKNATATEIAKALGGGSKKKGKGGAGGAGGGGDALLRGVRRGDTASMEAVQNLVQGFNSATPGANPDLDKSAHAFLTKLAADGKYVPPAGGPDAAAVLAKFPRTAARTARVPRGGGGGPAAGGGPGPAAGGGPAPLAPPPVIPGGPAPAPAPVTPTPTPPTPAPAAPPVAPAPAPAPTPAPGAPPAAPAPGAPPAAPPATPAPTPAPAPTPGPTPAGAAAPTPPPAGQTPPSGGRRQRGGRRRP